MTSLDIPVLRALAAAARERADKATAGPWDVVEHLDAGDGRGISACTSGNGIQNEWVRVSRPHTSTLHGTASVTHDQRDADAAFIAASRTDVPALAAALEQAVAEVERLRAVADAARELVRWDWLHLLCDSKYSVDVCDCVDELGMALAKYDTETKP